MNPKTKRSNCCSVSFGFLLLPGDIFRAKACDGRNLVRLTRIGRKHDATAGIIVLLVLVVAAVLSSSYGVSSASTAGVTFVESGLPSGTAWSVVVNGATYSSTTDTILITTLPNSSSYSWNVSPVRIQICSYSTCVLYEPSPQAGLFTRNALPLTVPITFAASNTVPCSDVCSLALNVTVKGLPEGSAWTIYVTNTSLSSAGPLSTWKKFVITNDTFDYQVTGNVGSSLDMSFQIMPPQGYEAYSVNNKTLPQERSTVFPGIEGGFGSSKAEVSLTRAYDITFTPFAIAGNSTTSQEINSATSNGMILAIVQVSSSGASTTLTSKGFSLTLGKVANNTLTMRISATGPSGPKVVLINISPNVLRLSPKTLPTVILDGQLVQPAQSPTQLFFPVNSTSPSYVLIEKASGYQLLVRIPHFSAHTLEVTGLFVASAGLSYFYLYATVIGGLVTLAIVAVLAIIWSGRHRQTRPYPQL